MERQAREHVILMQAKRKILRGWRKRGEKHPAQNPPGQSWGPPAVPVVVTEKAFGGETLICKLLLLLCGHEWMHWEKGHFG